jgi:uncharacterized membrane protein YfcA
MIFVVSILSVVSGSGGGSLYLPLIMFILSFQHSDAAAISNVLVLVS